MDEDEAYRASSQYRLWSFTANQLQERRIESNRIGAEKARAAFARKHAAHQDDESSPDAKAAPETIDTLTVEEEQVIVQWGCGRLMVMREHLVPRPPATIIATACQYLRRFYLVNSVMTYHPTQILVCALFLAMKAEHNYVSLGTFSSQLQLKEDSVKAPEFLLMQALRFTLDVRHPIQALEGWKAEIQRRAELQSISVLKPLSKEDTEKRIRNAYEGAYILLKSDVQMTDAYFLYTPPQIYLAALYITDKELTLAYVDDLLKHPKLVPVKQKLVDTIKACAALIQAVQSEKVDGDNTKEEKRVSKKLRKCQDPEKKDIVAMAQERRTSKFDGNDSDDVVAEKKAQKRKAEALKTVDRDGDVFGGDLKR